MYRLLENNRDICGTEYRTSKRNSFNLKLLLVCVPHPPMHSFEQCRSLLAVDKYCCKTCKNATPRPIREMDRATTAISVSSPSIRRVASGTSCISAKSQAHHVYVVLVVERLTCNNLNCF